MRAMILAAGRGERMRPLTDTTPKPLLQVGGKPLVIWHIERLVAAGIVDIVINHAWLGQQIEDTLGRGERFGARLHYSPETSALETAGGIAQALPFFDTRPFLVINGDVWCDWDPSQACAVATLLPEHKAEGWLLLVDNPDHHPDGDFALPVDGLASVDRVDSATRPMAYGRVQVLDTERRRPPGAQPLTFAGIGVYSPRLFAGIPTGEPAALGPLLRAAASENRVIGSYHGGQWTDVGTPERLNSLNRSLAARR